MISIPQPIPHTTDHAIRSLRCFMPQSYRAAREKAY